MAAPEIRVFKDLDDLSRNAAMEFRALASQSTQKVFSAALSGGSTPKPFYELLAAPEFSRAIPWSRVHLFQVDERAVPPDDARSNYKLIREAMLARVPEAHFHRMMAESPDLDGAAVDYEKDLRAVLAAAAGEWPRLDVIFLGIGDDGHTASLFPGTEALDERRLAVCANYVTKLKMFRMTLTFPVLNAAARVIFLVSGSGKAEMLRRVLRASQGEAPLPAQRVAPGRGTVSWYVDQAAARLL